jgi:hypothetical protein
MFRWTGHARTVTPLPGPRLLRLLLNLRYPLLVGGAHYGDPVAVVPVVRCSPPSPTHLIVVGPVTFVPHHPTVVGADAIVVVIYVDSPLPRALPIWVGGDWNLGIDCSGAVTPCCSQALLFPFSTFTFICSRLVAG